MKNRILTLFCGLLCAATSTVLAQDGGTTGPLSWLFENGTLTITGEGDMPDYLYTTSPWYYLKDSITALEIVGGVTRIGDYAFFDCTGLTSVTIPEPVNSIGRDAFNDCSGLTSVIIPNSIIAIGRNAFHLCSGLTSVIIPNSVTTIGSEAFYYCVGLTSVVIGNSVTDIGFGVFSTCIALTEVINYAAIPQSIYAGVFYEVDMAACTLYVPATSITAYQIAGVWKNFGTIEAILPVSGVSLNKTTLTLAVEGTGQLTATVAPSNATNKAVIWSSSHPAVAAVSSDGTVTALAPGTAIITASTYEGGYTAQCEVTIKDVGISGLNPGGSLKLYPNPTQGLLTVELFLPNGIHCVEIFEATGRAVETLPCLFSANGTATLDISHLPAGVYLLRIGNHTAKVLKQ